MNRTRDRVRWCHILTLSLLVSLAGCNLLVPFAFVGEHKRKVLPEFDKLSNQRVAILVWMDPATLFDYPYARVETASYVSDKLRHEMAQRRHETDVVDARDVEDFLQKNLDARVDPILVGRRFKADYVVFIEVLEFQIRDPEEPQFLRGRVEAAVTVHDVQSEAQAASRYTLTPVKCRYPDDQPVLMDATNSPLVREATYRLFAEEVARKFYEYSVDL